MKTCKRFPKRCPKSGVYHNIPAHEYHAWSAVSTSMLKVAATSMRACRAWLDSESRPPTAAMRLGTAVHAALFEPEVWAAAVEVGGLKPGATAATFQKYADQHGPIVLAEGWRDQIRKICESVESVAPDLVDGGEAEVCVVWSHQTEYGAIKCKSRLDYVKPDRMVEFKTCDGQYLEPSAFVSHAWKMLYHVQVVHEWEAFLRMSNKTEWMTVLAASTSEPYDAIVFEPTTEWIGRGMEIRSELLNQIAHSMKRKSWPGMASGPAELDVPEWAKRRVEL